MDLRKLFDQSRTAWKDRGANCARGHVNVPCPFCKNDPSYHMSINEVTGEYYCFRNPKHAGHSLAYLFNALGIPKKAYDATLSTFNLKGSLPDRAWTPDDRDYSSFRYFTPAEESDEALAYLESRLFSEPKNVCRQFNLKVSVEGEWAGRLILPLTVGWTGRSMRSHLNLRYKAHTSQDGYFQYNHHSSSAIIVEGAIDAMRIASVTNQFDVYGKCGNRLSPALLLTLHERRYLSVWNSPDGTVPFSQHRLETETLRSYCVKADVKWLRMDEEFKDFGASSETFTRQVLSVLGH
jgi:hypothetical protein